jgi:hypothetical protein
LNNYGFRKVKAGRNPTEYKHEFFSRDHPEKLILIKKKTAKNAEIKKEQNDHSSEHHPEIKIEDSSSSSSYPSILPTSPLNPNAPIDNTLIKKMMEKIISLEKKQEMTQVRIETKENVV